MKKKASVISRKKTVKNPETVPYHRKPAELSLEKWQIALRKQFVTVKNFSIKKLVRVSTLRLSCSEFNPRPGWHLY